MSVTNVLHAFLMKSLSTPLDAGFPFTDRILLFLMFHFKNDPNNQQAFIEIEKACSAVASQEGYLMEKTSTSACQSVCLFVKAIAT